MLNPTPIQKKLIAGGVRNLQEFGYPSCDETNILTDRIYSRFFEGILKDNIGQHGSAIDKEINAILAALPTR